jgi:hypothetical protein
LTKAPADVLNHAISEISSGSKLDIDATMELPGEDFKRPWPPMIRMDGNVRRIIDRSLGEFAEVFPPQLTWEVPVFAIVFLGVLTRLLSSASALKATIAAVLG